MYDALVTVLVYAVIVVIIWQVFALVWQMAEDRGHNPWGWMFISLCWSPFGSMFVMWLFFPIPKADT